MKRHHLGAAAALAGALATGVAAHPAAGTEPDPGTAVLDAMCRDKGGQPYLTPYTISRCQDARSRKGFDLEATICEDLLGGSFSVAAGHTRPHRSNWACVSGPATSGEGRR